MAKGVFFKQFRIGILLLVLALVALDAWLAGARTQDWSDTERIAVYPIAGDPGLQTRRYLDRLDEDAFNPVEKYFAAQGSRYGIQNTQPVELKLRTELTRLPPRPPVDTGMLKTAWWSLRLRYWAWQVTRDDPGPYTRIRLFVVFHDPASRRELPQSHGLRKLLVGVAHVFASRNQESVNSVVVAHELLHTFGATDKYDPATNLPVYPHGFAEPERQPLFPQRFAEIMGGRVPVSPQSAEIPPGLGSTLVGATTAREIAWPQ